MSASKSLFHRKFKDYYKMFKSFLTTKTYANSTSEEYSYLVERVLEENRTSKANRFSVPYASGLIKKYSREMRQYQGQLGGRIMLYGGYGNDAVLNALIQYREFLLVRAYRDHLVQARITRKNELSMNEIGECMEIMTRVCAPDGKLLFVLGRAVGQFLFNEARPIRNRAIHEFMLFVDLHPDWFATQKSGN